jgi:DNA-binding transcriptional regulator/RsmH inhibitor MraZ
MDASAEKRVDHYCGLFIKSVNAKAVTNELRKSLERTGHRPVPERIDDKGRLHVSANYRGLAVSKSRDGWVAVLDSDQSQVPALAAGLSKNLETYALATETFRNFPEIHHWQYSLYHIGNQIDFFDHSRFFYTLRLESGYGLRRRPRKRPADMAEIVERIARGETTAADEETLLADVRKNFNIGDRLIERAMETLGVSSAPAKAFLIRDEFETTLTEERWQILQPILPAGTTREEIVAALEFNWLPELLHVLGVGRAYEDLTYAHLFLGDWGDSLINADSSDGPTIWRTYTRSLTPHGVHFPHHLSYERIDEGAGNQG